MQRLFRPTLPTLALALGLTLPALGQAQTPAAPASHGPGAAHAWSHTEFFHGEHGPLTPERKQALLAHAKQKLEREAVALEIKASQTEAWEAYTAAHLALVESFLGRSQPAKDADAATVTRQRAEWATDLAQQLSRVADATAKLQGVLDENQRKVLDRYARHLGFHHARDTQGNWHGAGPGHTGQKASPPPAKP